MTACEKAAGIIRDLEEQKARMDAAEFIRDWAKQNQQRILRKKELLAMIGLSDATIWRMERDGKFPKRVRLGSNSCGWFESEVLNWMAELAEARGEPYPP